MTGVVRASWQEARPVVQVIFQLRFVAGVVLGGGTATTHLVDQSVLLAAASWLAATWCVYLVNGIADVVEDRENGSTRPIARGALPVAAATRMCYVLAVVAVTCGVLVSSRSALLVLLVLLVGWSYSMGPWPLKNSMPGFLAGVVSLGLLTYLAGWSAVGGGWNTTLVVTSVAMSLWMGLVGATKDLSDVRGDRVAGRRTAPVVLGVRRAKALMAALAVSLGLAFLTTAVVVVPRLLPVGVVVCSGACAVAVLLLSAAGRGGRCAERRPYRAFMTTQYAAHMTLLSADVVS
ncbi:UbiA family prenyltransferase [Actinophytocola oryzae]|nr:UbiA family prenyltransferase [Actinophytocola oryzae]